MSIQASDTESASPDNKPNSQPMWHDKLGIISIGAQCGGPEDNGLSDIKIDLWKLFMRNCTDSCCSSVGHYALGLRIGGEFQDFGSESVGSIRRSKRDRSIGAEIVVPQKVWEQKTRNELRDYLAVQVRTALQLCVKRLQKDKEQVDEAKLFREIDKAIELFTEIDYE